MNLSTGYDHQRAHTASPRWPRAFSRRSFPPPQTRGWNFKNLLRNKLRLTWGWAEVLSIAHIVQIFNRLAWPELSSLSLMVNDGGGAFFSPVIHRVQGRSLRSPWRQNLRLNTHILRREAKQPATFQKQRRKQFHQPQEGPFSRHEHWAHKELARRVHP